MNETINENAYKYWLHRLPEIGDATIYSLLEEFGTAQGVYNAVAEHNHKVKSCLKSKKMVDILTQAPDSPESLEIEYQRMLDKNIHFVTIDDVEYPERLRLISRPPYAIYYKGRLPEDDVPAVAIIGARDCSEYGTFVANEFGKELAGQGINIISGMARGVDGISQRGALNAGGNTFGILGSGVDVCYPMGNYKLYKDIQQNGGILSTFPPGREAMKIQFPERNRIVAALSDLILVVEARAKSGTSITVELALKMGKDVYAVPGRLTDRLSDGCNMLIRNGAGIALAPEDVIRELGFIWQMLHPESNKLKQDLIPKLNKGPKPKDIGVLKYLDSNPKSIDEIHTARVKEEPDTNIQQTFSELVMLCTEGKAVQVMSGYFHKCL